MDKFTNGLFYVLFSLINFFLLMITLSTLWGWFVVPIGVPAIGLAHAFGLSLIVSYFQVRNPKMFKPEVLIQRSLSQRFGFNFGITLSALLIGYVTQLFM